MRLLFSIFTLFICFNLFSQQNNIVPGEFIIQLKKEVNDNDFRNYLRDNPSFNIQVSKTLSKRFNIFLCTSSIGNETEVLKQLQSIPMIKVAQHNHFVQQRETLPNDPSFNNQWALKNTGQNGGVEGADIDATLAWDVTTGGATALGDTIVVAVIDGGFQMNHPDLVPNYFVNKLEVPNNGIDDDNNGYIDDVSGWDAYNDDGTIPNDQHGTHVSGIIGAVGDNDLGIAGVNWNVKILPIAGSSGNESTVVAAYSYAADMRIIYNETNGEQGAFVVSTNSSFGVDQGDPADYPIWCAFYDELGAAGILSCGATANANFNIDQTGDIPTACASEFLISVTNSTRNDDKANGAAFGIESIDIAAPGSSIYSTITNGNYGNLTGTSMATPQVAGSIALMYAAACDVLISDYKANPAAVTLQMKEYLYQGAESLESLDGLVDNSRRLNVNGAIQQVLTYICDTETPPVANFSAAGRSGCPGLEVNFNNFSSSNAESFLWEFPGGSPSSSTEANPQVVYNNFGNYNVNLIVSNVFGSDTVSFDNYVEVTNTGIRTVYSEGFETGSLESMGFTIENPDQQNTWELSNSQGIAGSSTSLGINMFNNTGNAGEWDYITLPEISLAETSENVLEIKYAHRRKSTGEEDSLIVNISSNGGASWTRLDAKGGGSNSSNMLATNVLLTSSFVPESTADWCIGDECLAIDISDWDGNPSVLIRLDAFNDGGNNIYVDDLAVRGLCTTPVVSPSVALFASQNQEICVGNSVQFNNTSENSTSFQWTFEGGEPSTSIATNPNVVYSESGTYDVTLIASNAEFADTTTFEAYITVNEAPAAPEVNFNNGVLSVDAQGTFQWYLNDSFISGANSSTWTAQQNGMYSVAVTNNGCTVFSDEIDVTVTSLNSLDNSSLQVFPNPARNMLNINVQSADFSSYQLFDAIGRSVIESTLVKGNNVVSLSNLKPGLYILTVRGESSIKTYQIIHQ